MEFGDLEDALFSVAYNGRLALLALGFSIGLISYGNVEQGSTFKTLASQIMGCSTSYEDRLKDS